MSTNVSNSDTTSKLQRLLKKHAEIQPELAKYEQSAKALDNEEKKLLETVDITDEKDFKKISDVRLKKELMPRKIASLREQEEEFLYEINMECLEVISIFRNKVADIQNEGLKLIAAALTPFLGSGQILWEEAAAVVKATDWCINANRTISAVTTEGFLSGPPLSKARQLLLVDSDIEQLITSFRNRFPASPKPKEAINNLKP